MKKAQNILAVGFSLDPNAIDFFMILLNYQFFLYEKTTYLPLCPSRNIQILKVNCCFIVPRASIFLLETSPWNSHTPFKTQESEKINFNMRRLMVREEKPIRSDRCLGSGLNQGEKWEIITQYEMQVVKQFKDFMYVYIFVCEIHSSCKNYHLLYSLYVGTLQNCIQFVKYKVMLKYLDPMLFSAATIVCLILRIL